MTGLPEIGLALATSFASGLNLYATVAVLSGAQRLGWVALPAGLEPLGHPVVFWVSVVLFWTEFFADKVPLVDTAWDALHTLVRPVAAAALGFGIFNGAAQPWPAIAALLAGSVALTAHGAKAGTRAVVNASPEPFSNWVLSIVEDAIAIGLTAFAMQHPAIAAVIVLILLVIAVWVIRKAVRLLRGLGRKLFGETRPAAPLPPPPSSLPP